jgi:Predicted membrane protein (DUF2231)
VLLAGDAIGADIAEVVARFRMEGRFSEQTDGVFSTVFGIPAHPLFMHAAVVFVPLLALFAVLYALIPRWRAKIGWATAILAVIAPLSALITKLSGDKFITYRFPQGAPSNVLAHRHFGTMLLWFTLGLGIATALLLFVHRWSRQELRPAWLRVGSQLLAIVLAVLAVYYVVRAGDSGAAAVWGRS